MSEAPEGRILLAFSGGPDSLGLASLLRDGEPLLAYVDHRLRGPRASRAERRAVAAAADRLGLDLRRARVSPSGPGEASARRERYRVLARLARKHGCAAIATAHSADDRAETVLLNLLRGSGLRGLSGMRECARVGGLFRIRPALGLRRSTLRSLGERHGPAAVDDSNRASDRLRSRLRAELLPALAQALGEDPVPLLLALADEAEGVRALLEERAAGLAGDAGRARLLREPAPAFPYLVEELRRRAGLSAPPLHARAYAALRCFLLAGRAGRIHRTPGGDSWRILDADLVSVSLSASGSPRPVSSPPARSSSTPRPPRPEAPS